MINRFVRHRPQGHTLSPIQYTPYSDPAAVTPLLMRVVAVLIHSPKRVERIV